MDLRVSDLSALGLAIHRLENGRKNQGNLCDSYSLHWNLLETLESRGKDAAVAYVSENIAKIDEAFFSGKSEELLKFLMAT